MTNFGSERKFVILNKVEIDLYNALQICKCSLFMIAIYSTLLFWKFCSVPHIYLFLQSRVK